MYFICRYPRGSVDHHGRSTSDTHVNMQRRAKFRPNLYHRIALEAPKKPHARPPARGFLRIFSFFTSSKSRDTPHHHQHKHPHGKEADTNKKVVEVWFAGSHSGMLNFFHFWISSVSPR